MASAPIDPTPGAASRLDEPAVELVRVALRRYAGEGADSAPLRTSLATLSAHARDRGVLPEHLVVLVKNLWSAMPEVRTIHDVGDQLRRQQAVVTMCIKEYFSP